MGNILPNKCEKCIGLSLPNPQESSLNKKYSPQETEAPSSGSESTATSEKKLSIKDFRWVKKIGEGSFGEVFLVQKKSNQKYYALKRLRKADIIMKKMTRYVFTEKDVLRNSSHPFVVKLRYSFQTDARLYLVMDYLPGGELFKQLEKKGRFDERMVRFYASEVILAIEYLHEKLNVIYRDLKPENILLDAKGHIKITDFGIAKVSTKAKSFSGTPEYLAPEILVDDRDYGRSVDWWCLGCLIYEMLAGTPPFRNNNRGLLFKDILEADPFMPNYFSKEAVDLLEGLLNKDPEKRLGAHGANEIKNHPFFKYLNWEEVLNKKIKPPVLSDNFNKEFDRTPSTAYLDGSAEESPTDITLLQDLNDHFRGFSFRQSSYLDVTLTSGEAETLFNNV